MSYTLINSAGLNLNAVEDLWIKIEAKPAPIVVGVIYRHPNYDVDSLNSFGDELANKLHSYNLNNVKYCILGDIIINLLNIKNSGNIRKYANNLINCSCKCLLDLPTRISQNSKTLIDHIYTNIADTKVESGIAVTDISNHCGTLANFLLKSVCKNTKSYNFVRDMKNFQPELFLESLNKKLNTFALSDNKPVYPQFNKFMTILTDTVNEHAPLKKASRREKRLQQKPWLTQGLLKSIKVRATFKNYNATSLNSYKAYRNVLNRAIEFAKQNFYQTALSTNQKSPEKL